MTLELENGYRWRALGALLIVAGFAVTVQFFRTLPEEPVVYILAYVPPATLLAVGGLLAFGGTAERLFR